MMPLRRDLRSYVEKPDGSGDVLFAVIDFLAAVGLWLATPWGGVLWLFAAVAQVLIAVGVKHSFSPSMDLACDVALIADLFHCSPGRLRVRPSDPDSSRRVADGVCRGRRFTEVRVRAHASAVHRVDPAKPRCPILRARSTKIIVVNARCDSSRATRSSSFCRGGRRSIVGAGVWRYAHRIVAIASAEADNRRFATAEKNKRGEGQDAAQAQQAGFAGLVAGDGVNGYPAACGHARSRGSRHAQRSREGAAEHFDGIASGEGGSQAIRDVARFRERNAEGRSRRSRRNSRINTDALRSMVSPSTPGCGNCSPSPP